MGLPETGRSRKPLNEVMEAAMTDWLNKAGRKILRDDEKVDDGLRRIARQVAQDEIGKKPEVTVVISRMAE
jgi:ribonuclease J